MPYVLNLQQRATALHHSKTNHHMLAVCEALGNNLNEGLLEIIDFTFSALPHTEKQKKLLISLFWRQLVERLEFGDIQVY